jgi:NADPH:quinone reductase-like Zn-dependent oxidoreductase
MAMNMMNAAVIDRAGGPEELHIASVPRPEPGLTEILVRVHAAGVNPVDWKVRAERGPGYPLILGWDVAGVVSAAGEGVTIYRPGDEVYGMPLFPRFPGGYAEYVVAPARHFAPKPPALSFTEAAALPLAALTAWQGLVDTAGLRAGQRVLIHAAGGGVGHLAVQIAKHLGAYVIGTASTVKVGFVRGLGADEVIDYTTTDFVSAAGQVDVALDPVAGDYGLRTLQVIRDGGQLVSILDVPEDALKAAAARGISAGFTLVEPDRLALSAITDLVNSGALRPVVDSVFPLERAADAHRYGESGHTAGKIVLTVG